MFMFLHALALALGLFNGIGGIGADSSHVYSGGGVVQPSDGGTMDT